MPLCTKSLVVKHVSSMVIMPITRQGPCSASDGGGCTTVVVEGIMFSRRNYVEHVDPMVVEGARRVERQVRSKVDRVDSGRRGALLQGRSSFVYSSARRCTG